MISSWCCVQQRWNNCVLGRTDNWGSSVSLRSVQAEWSRVCCRQRGWFWFGVSGAVDPACFCSGQHPVWQRLQSLLLPGCDRGLRSLRRPQRMILNLPYNSLHTVCIHINYTLLLSYVKTSVQYLYRYNLMSSKQLENIFKWSFSSALCD